jgi:hypothetical protein
MHDTEHAGADMRPVTPPMIASAVERCRTFVKPRLPA